MSFGPRGTCVAFALALACTLLGASAASAESQSKPYTRDGVFVRLDAGSGALWLTSTGSVSNGFAQELPSRASGVFLPDAGVAVGGTVPLGAPPNGSSLGLGGRLGVASAREPVFETLGRRFTLADTQLTLITVLALADYYPHRQSGLHFGAGVGTAALGLSSGSLGAGFGFALSLEVGHAFFVARQWSLGAELRATLARTSGRDGRDIATTLFSPTLCVIATLH
jgi:hypothetical protein